MDPFEVLPSAVFDYILLHFSGRETLKATEVSPLWDEVIGCSNTAMKKIKIKISWHPHRSFFEDAADLMVQSPRKYQNLDFLHQSSFKNSIKMICDILYASRRQWKSVTLKRVTFDTIGEVTQLFEIISPTIESLEIQEIYMFNRRSKVVSGLHFPKLKNLRVKHMDMFFIDAFASCKKLKNIAITSGDPLPPAVKAFKQILENNDLTSLEISSNLFKNVFDEDISLRTSFKLKSFVASELFKIMQNIATIRMNFHNFLQSQMKNLETLSVDEWFGMDLFKFMFHLPQLKSLSINGLNNIEVMTETADLHLHTSNSITKLTFHDMDPQFKIVKALIDAMPKLEQLEMHSLYQNSMVYLSQHATYLKSLKLRTIEATDLSGTHLFPKLEEFSIDVISSDLEDEIINIRYQDRNRLVKLLLQSSYTILH